MRPSSDGKAWRYRPFGSFPLSPLIPVCHGSFSLVDLFRLLRLLFLFSSSSISSFFTPSQQSERNSSINRILNSKLKMGCHQVLMNLVERRREVGRVGGGGMGFWHFARAICIIVVLCSLMSTEEKPGRSWIIQWGPAVTITNALILPHSN